MRFSDAASGLSGFSKSRCSPRSTNSYFASSRAFFRVTSTDAKFSALFMVLEVLRRRGLAGGEADAVEVDFADFRVDFVRDASIGGGGLRREKVTRGPVWVWRVLLCPVFTCVFDLLDKVEPNVADTSRSAQ